MVLSKLVAVLTGEVAPRLLAPAPRGAPLRELAAHAWQRERLLASAIVGRTQAATRRVPADGWATGWRGIVRKASRDGALVELSRRARPLDRICAAAGLQPDQLRLRVTSDGSLLGLPLQPQRRAAQALVLRIDRAQAGTVARHSEALRAAGAVPHARAPAVVAEGVADGWAWSTTALLPGRARPRLTEAQLEAVARWTAQLSRPGTATGPALHQAAVAAAMPERADAISARLAPHREDLAHLPAAFGHGDLWSYNLLFSGPELTGVLDWDCLMPRAAAGVDLLACVVGQVEVRGMPFASVWAGRPWRGPLFQRLSMPVWAASRRPPDDRLYEAVGLAWWLSAVAGELLRNPATPQRPGWQDAIVTPVLAESVISPPGSR